MKGVCQVLGLTLVILVLMFFTYYWWQLCVNLMLWWCQVLYATIGMMGKAEAVASFIAVAFAVLCMMPYFIMAPWLLVKELLYFYRHPTA